MYMNICIYTYVYMYISSALNKYVQGGEDA